MWIVRLALRRPYTIAVIALLLLVLGTLSLTRMIVDIFSSIDIPVVVIWNYPGLSPEDMERRVVINERHTQRLSPASSENRIDFFNTF